MNKIICGNSQTELKKLETESVDLIITSPPYYNQRDYSEDKDLEIGNENHINDYFDRLDGVFSECLRICKRTGSIVFNVGDIYYKKDLQLLPYRFAIKMKDRYSPPLKLINEITWVKSNPTPRQYNKRLISSTEPFFHFVRSDNYYYDRNSFLDDGSKDDKVFYWQQGKGRIYPKLIKDSDLTDDEKRNAMSALTEAICDYRIGKITDFRMKIRGVHKKAFGGQAGGRNNQIDNQGFTVIKMYGKKLKRDVIETSVANTRNIDHPAVFPLKVIMEMVKLLSMENGVVLDPFCGSGQTCLAAKMLNRQYLGIDLNPKFCDLAIKRIGESEL